MGSKTNKRRRANKIVLAMGQYSERCDRALINITKGRSLTGNSLIWEDLNFKVGLESKYSFLSGAVKRSAVNFKRL